MAALSRADRRRSQATSREVPETQPVARPARIAAPTAVPTEIATNGAVPVVLLGASRWLNETVVPALALLEGRGEARVAAVVPGAAGEVRARFPAALAADSLDALATPKQGLAIVAEPTSATLVAAALKKGWHVFGPAPLAAGRDEAQRLVAAAERAGRLVAVDHSFRLLPAANYLATLCRDQLLGPLFHFEIHEPSSNMVDALAPDGVLVTAGALPLDLLTHWLGSPTIHRYADDAMGGVEANAQLELSFAEGIRGTIHLTRDWPIRRRWDFAFERGHVRWNPAEPLRLGVQLASTGYALDAQLAPRQVEGETRTPGPVVDVADALADQLRSVLAATAHAADREPLLAAAILPLPLIEECYGRRTLLEQPWLSHNEAACARALSNPAQLRRP